MKNRILRIAGLASLIQGSFITSTFAANTDMSGKGEIGVRFWATCFVGLIIGSLIIIRSSSGNK